ncbi:hypothetical protein [Morganella morganii]|uniref:hypothetical protein n=1 Tax=Morganella morganii TaxID=582 RepID=UPI00222E3B3F|nr:hypothetical protein [Morganella morganii]MDM8751603.1 hypothetical protein [Morganella morganii]HEI9870810.1 hypothetical protein [Morganella morganii]
MENQNQKDKYDGLLFDIRRSTRYHRRRQKFYTCMDNLSNFVSLICGSSVIYTALSVDALKSWTLYTAIAITATSAVSILLAFSQKARDHSNLANDFIALEIEIIEIDKDVVTLEQLNNLIKKRLRIEVKEPPCLIVLDSICYNEQSRAAGLLHENEVVIGWFQRLCAPFFDFNTHKLHLKTEIDNCMSSISFKDRLRFKYRFWRKYRKLKKER